MWTRVELKERGKAAFRRNYWKCVVVALIMAFIIGGNSSGSSNSGDTNDTVIDQGVTDFVEDSIIRFEDGTGDFMWEDSPSVITDTVTDSVDSLSRTFLGNFSLMSIWKLLTGTVFGIIALFLAVVSILIQIFVLNVAEVGGSRFFLKNAHAPAEVKEILFGFQGSYYLNLVKITFWKDLYIFLWSLLLIIPGIIKSYEYYMVPYLLSEYPDMPKDEVFARSREMMYGNKWNTFVLNLSFILWDLLSSVTLGLVGIFWVNPYKSATDAELYHVLKYK